MQAPKKNNEIAEDELGSQGVFRRARLIIRLNFGN